MTWSIRFDEDDATLRVTNHGILDSARLRRMSIEVIAAAQRYQAGRVLVDQRDMQPGRNG